MDVISITASIVAILQLSSRVLGYLNDVKDASKDRAFCAIEAANLNSLLTALRFHLEEGDFTTPWYTAIRTLAIENGPLDQFKQSLEQLQEKITGRGKMGKAGNALVWKFKKQEIASILGRMERLKTLVDVALQMDHFKLSQAIKESGDATRSNMELIRNDTKFIRHEADHAQYRKLMEWISPMDFPIQQSDFIARRQAGTGQWFLNASEVAQWLRAPKETLFCPGIPGAGKTMIAATAIDYLLNKVQSSSIGVAYIYCNYKAQEEQSINNLLAAILKQLVQTRSSLMEPVEQLYMKHVDQRTRPSVDEIFTALLNVLANFSVVHLVIDAVDECRDSDGTRRLFLDKLHDLRAKTDLRMMVTSRFIPDILDRFETALRLDIRASDEDVKRFIAGQFYRLPRCIHRDAALQEMVQDKIIKAVDGMFLLARLYTDSLQDKRTPKEVKSFLARLSKGSNALDDAYGGAIQRIDCQLSGDSERAKKVFYWITYAERPLNTAEICCALAVESGEVELDPENIPEIEDLLSVCAGLVEVDPESTIIRLVHYTAQEYFERIMKQWMPSALLQITSTCLTYLCFDAFKAGSSATDEEFENRIRQNKFLDYAAKYWGEHAIRVEGEACEQVSSFILHEGLISCAAQVMSASTYKFEGHSQICPTITKTTSLHLTARFGLTLVSEKILRYQVRGVAIAVDSTDSCDETPLYVAASHGNLEMVKLLLHKGSNVNIQGGTLWTALQVASHAGHEEVVKLLLEKGADVDIQGGDFWTALQAASYTGHEEIIKLLLEKGADVNIQGGRFWTVLQVASYIGHEEIIKLLLEKGADVDIQGGDFWTALQAASSQGHEEIVKLLLEKGADVDIQGGAFWTALQAASYHGHEEIVKLLLEKGADVDIQGGAFWTALQAASYIGHEEIIKLLLEKGADVDIQGGAFWTALQAASYYSHEEIIKLLLEKGADVNIQGGTFWTALQAASSQGYKQIVRLLLDNGADVNTYYENGYTALQQACYNGHEHITKLLLNKGADIDAQSHRYGNALMIACDKGYEQIVRLLLDNGAGVNTHDKSGYTALHKASYEGHTDLLRLIYDQYYGAPLLLDLHGRTPLQLAAGRGHFDAFHYLLSLGFDPAMTDAKGDNLLQYASSGGSLEILNEVMQIECLSCTQSEHWSPIHWACRNGNPHIVERLIKEGIQSGSVTVSKPKGKWNPIAIAIFHRQGKMLEKLDEYSMSTLDTVEGSVQLHGKRIEGYCCDGCFHDIYGPRFHCRTCLDLDYCFMCKPFLTHLHENHEWDCFEPPMDD